jgi:hypothetical protein
MPAFEQYCMPKQMPGKASPPPAAQKFHQIQGQREAMASPKAPTPGSMMLRAAEAALYYWSLDAHPKNLRALVTLKRLLAP